MINCCDRIATLRFRCLSRKNRALSILTPWMVELLRQTEGILPWPIRRGTITKHLLERLEFELDDLELLIGRIKLPKFSQQELERAERSLQDFELPGGQRGHCELDRTDLLTIGIAGIHQRILKLRSTAGPDEAAYHTSFLLALEGLQARILNAATTAESAMGLAQGIRRAELERIAVACKHIAYHPPRNFFEGLQLFWLVDSSGMWDGSWLLVPGHLDRTLWPLYQNDIAEGKITPELALELLECLYLLLNEDVPDGLAMSIMVGGRDVAGNDATNELSYLCLEALRRTRLIYPTVGVCWHEQTPPALTALAIDLVTKGYPTPAFFNDDVIQKGLYALNVPPELACNYINSTCVEITPAGSSGVWVASPYFNLCQLLLDEIDHQAKSDAPANTFDNFLNCFSSRLGVAIEEAADCQNKIRTHRANRGGMPLQSCFTRDCIKRGRDVDSGGALYNWVECSFVGLANLADSLQAIRNELYNKMNITFASLKQSLDSDFKDDESLRLRLLNGSAKYGNDCQEVDALVAQVAKSFQDHCRRQKMLPDDSAFVPGSFCWVMHERLGRETGATPDGRKAGFPFADGGGPAQGRERLGPTAAILSTTSWDHSPMIGGLAYNMKFNAALFGSPSAAKRLGDLVVTFLRRGGFETQINVVDHKILLAAKANPEQYRDLAVRVGGYVDYFTRLSPQMQEEVLLRTEFERL